MKSGDSGVRGISFLEIGGDASGDKSSERRRDLMVERSADAECGNDIVEGNGVGVGFENKSAVEMGISETAPRGGALVDENKSDEESKSIDISGTGFLRLFVDNFGGSPARGSGSGGNVRKLKVSSEAKISDFHIDDGVGLEIKFE